MTPIRTMLAAIAVGTSLLFPASLLPSHPMKPGSTEGGFGILAQRGFDPGYGTYAWPVVGPVIRGFEPPPNPYGPGHRGIDIGAPFGTEIVAAQDGIVAFAGWVGGSLFISIDHGDGVRTRGVVGFYGPGRTGQFGQYLPNGPIFAKRKLARFDLS